MNTPIDRADITAMRGFAERVPEMSDQELIAAAKWICERSWWDVTVYRKRWPWWSLDTVSKPIS